MSSELSDSPVDTRRLSLRSRTVLLGVVLVALVAVVVVVVAAPRRAGAESLPLRMVGEISLPGDTSRLDYASLDPGRALLFVAHLGASEVIEVDLAARRAVRTIPNLSQVHGVLVVPAVHRVYASATGANRAVILDEATAAVLAQAPTGEYPDGLAYDPRRGAIWITNESGGSETVIDAATAAVRGTVALGGEVGNVAYDPVADQILVAVQGRNDLAVIDPTTFAITRRAAVAGCEHGHGLALDPVDRLAFIGCEGNATLVTLDLATLRVIATNPVGDTPDVLAYDPGPRRLYVAAEDGTVSILDQRGRATVLVGSGHLADGAHVVAVDPISHHSFYPVPHGADGHPALLEMEPTQ
jgi:DNA-binding beta-propeller fold protein YncE